MGWERERERRKEGPFFLSVRKILPAKLKFQKRRRREKKMVGRPFVLPLPPSDKNFRVEECGSERSLLKRPKGEAGPLLIY